MAEQMTNELPDVLYHYCSVESLSKIVESKCLRMTNIFSMDDTTEYFWLFEVAMRVLDEWPEAARDERHSTFQKMFQNRSLQHVYCTSFSEQADSRSQWLEYADDGHGVAIGFRPSQFDLQRNARDRSLELKRVIYDEKEQQEIVRKMVDDAYRHPRTGVPDGMVEFFLRTNTWWNAPLCKNPAFESEREWRLVLRDDPGDKMKFHVRARRHLVPYVEGVELDPSESPIAEIWFGPRNTSNRSRNAIVQFLRAHGFDQPGEIGIEYKVSKVPLRPEY